MPIPVSQLSLSNAISSFSMLLKKYDEKVKRIIFFRK